jgi:ferrous iron transport protein B
MVLALNMIDEAHERGVSIDAPALAVALGIPVIEMIAVEGRGLSELRDALPRAARPLVPAHPHANDRAVWAHQLTVRVRRVSTLSLAYVQEALARATRRPVTGLPILAAVLYALYLFVGVFGAQTLVKLLEDGLFGGYINPAATWAGRTGSFRCPSFATSSSASTASSRWGSPTPSRLCCRWSRRSS